MTTFVFLGPTLQRQEAQGWLDAEYLPPVAMGDLHALAASRARPGDRIAIIDGLFEQVPAVWHKEILFTLERGIAVYGASSMGALRAAELHAFGMHGVGRIFEAYRDGIIEDDDEVVVAHATAENGYRVLSHAMVSLRFGLAALHGEGVIDSEQRDLLIAAAKGRHYSTRSWAAVAADARDAGLPEAAVTALRGAVRRFDFKADDARALLQRLGAEAAQGPATFTAHFVLENTAFWTGLTATHAATHAADLGETSSGDSEVLTYLRAAHPDRTAILRDAALLRLAAARTSDWTPTTSDLTAAAFRITRRNGIASTDALRSWRQCNGLTGELAWRDLLDLDSRAELLMQHLLPDSNRFALAALKAGGRYGAALAHAEALRGRFGPDRTKHLSLEDAGVTPEALQSWYERRCGRMYPDPEAHSGLLGFETLRDFITEILASYMIDYDQRPLH